MAGFDDWDEWDPKAALESLVDEKSHFDESDEQLAKRLFKEASPRAALSIIHMAAHSQNERIRLDASKYITERVLGPASSPASEGESDTPLEDLLGDIVGQIEQYANSNTSHGGEEH